MSAASGEIEIEAKPDSRQLSKREFAIIRQQFPFFDLNMLPHISGSIPDFTRNFFHELLTVTPFSQMTIFSEVEEQNTIKKKFEENITNFGQIIEVIKKGDIPANIMDKYSENKKKLENEKESFFINHLLYVIINENFGEQIKKEIDEFINANEQEAVVTPFAKKIQETCKGLSLNDEFYIGLIKIYLTKKGGNQKLFSATGLRPGNSGVFEKGEGLIEYFDYTKQMKRKNVSAIVRNSIEEKDLEIDRELFKNNDFIDTQEIKNEKIGKYLQNLNDSNEFEQWKILYEKWEQQGFSFLDSLLCYFYEVKPIQGCIHYHSNTDVQNEVNNILSKLDTNSHESFKKSFTYIQSQLGKLSCTIKTTFFEKIFLQDIKKIHNNPENQNLQKSLKVKCDTYSATTSDLLTYYSQDSNEVVKMQIINEYTKRIEDAIKQIHSITTIQIKCGNDVRDIISLRTKNDALSGQYAYKSPKKDTDNKGFFLGISECHKEIYDSIEFEGYKLSSQQVQTLCEYDTELQFSIKEQKYQGENKGNDIISYLETHPTKSLARERNRYLGECIEELFLKKIKKTDMINEIEYRDTMMSEQFRNELIVNLCAEFHSKKTTQLTWRNEVVNGLPCSIKDVVGYGEDKSFSAFIEKTHYEKALNQYKFLILASITGQDMTREQIRNHVTKIISNSLMCLYEMVLTRTLFLEGGEAEGRGVQDLGTLYDCIIRGMTIYQESQPIQISVGYGGHDGELLPRSVGYHASAHIFRNIFDKYGIKSENDTFHAYRLSATINGLNSQETKKNAEGVKSLTDAFVRTFVDPNSQGGLHILGDDDIAFLNEQRFLDMCSYVKKDYEAIKENDESKRSDEDKTFVKAIEELIHRAQDHAGSEIYHQEALDRAIKYTVSHPLIFGDIVHGENGGINTGRFHSIKIGSPGERAFNVIQKRIADAVRARKIQGFYITNYTNGDKKYRPLHRTHDGASKPGYYPVGEDEPTFADIGETIHSFKDYRRQFYMPLLLQKEKKIIEGLKVKSSIIFSNGILQESIDDFIDLLENGDRKIVFHTVDQKKDHIKHAEAMVNARKDIQRDIKIIMYTQNCSKEEAEEKYWNFLVECKKNLTI